MTPRSKELREMAQSNHVHVASVYVRCKDCLMFGTPMPLGYDCGNCGSNNTESYSPSCCMEKAYALGREAGFADAQEQAAKVSWCHECDSRCKDIGLGPHCTMTVAYDIRALSTKERSEKAAEGERG